MCSHVVTFTVSHTHARTHTHVCNERPSSVTVQSSAAVSSGHADQEQKGLHPLQDQIRGKRGVMCTASVVYHLGVVLSNAHAQISAGTFLKLSFLHLAHMFHEKSCRSSADGHTVSGEQRGAGPGEGGLHA
jgi:hypothetical protein